MCTHTYVHIHECFICMCTLFVPMDECESSWVLGTDLDPLQEQRALFTTEASLQPPYSLVFLTTASHN